MRKYKARWALIAAVALVSLGCGTLTRESADQSTGDDDRAEKQADSDGGTKQNKKKAKKQSATGDAGTQRDKDGAGSDDDDSDDDGSDDDGNDDSDDDDDDGSDDDGNDDDGNDTDGSDDDDSDDDTPPINACGNGQLDPGEDCDGTRLNANTCLSLGFVSGTLKCTAGCNLDTAACVAAATCGNGIVDGSEQCDDGAENANARPDACRKNCTLPSCGDGVVDQGEGCDDGSDNSDGRADRCRSDCQPARCGDGIVDSAEDCETGLLGLSTCQSLGFAAGTLGCSDCNYDTSSCVVCGDGIANGDDPEAADYEECDGDDLRGATCADLGLPAGEVTCSGCRLDTSMCSEVPIVCGDNRAEGEELCDGFDFRGETCLSQGMGFTGGSLTCTSCTSLNTSRCNTCGDGVLDEGETCDDGNTTADFTCSADCRYECSPGFGTCDGDTSTYCEVDGDTTRIVVEQCDPLQGSTCVAGRCTGPCALSTLGSSYIGCDYYATVTDNSLLNVTSTGFTFAMAVANSGGATAHITVTQGATTIGEYTVDTGDIVIIEPPWVETLRTGRTVLAEEAAYRVRSDQPVTVYQYNPLDYTNGTTNTYTNDASLLLPTNTWSGSYVVLSWPTNSGRPGFYAVVAKEDETTVTLVPSATTPSIYGTVPGLNADGTGTVVLNAGDVLQVTATDAVADLTGTQVFADKPIEVFGGHECTNVPLTVTYCDHLEDAMMPFEALGLDYIVSTPLITTAQTKPRIVRIVATLADTNLVYDPPQAGAPTFIPNAGDFVEFESEADFLVSADHKILIGEFMLGESAGGGRGDPAMALAVPYQQYRTQYLFHAPSNYEANYVNIHAPSTAGVLLDGAAVTTFTPIGTTGFGVARVELDNSGNGNHTIEATEGVGISVYGYGDATSYWYPGGLELLVIPQQ